MLKPVIGLEIHCELNTKSKMFSGSKNEYEKMPNENISEIDLALPGILPLPNIEGVRKAIKLALALNCEIPDEVMFDRKNYYYADLPKGYQITQMTKPFGKNGYLDIEVDGKVKRVTIHQLHLEEDSASMDHFSNYSLINYNRAGVPLVEIVTDPVFYNEKEVVEFLESLRTIIKYLDVSDASSDKGELRVDVNISMKEESEEKLGVRAEIKNINSFNSVKETILYEEQRQREVLESGGKVIQETRRWVDDEKVTVSMREKVDAIDYKYYVEPNIPVVPITKEFISDIEKTIPELPNKKKERFISLGVNEKDAKTIIRNVDLCKFYDEVLTLGGDAKDASNWITTRLLGYMSANFLEVGDVYLTPEMLVNLMDMVKNGKISSQQAKEVFVKVLDQKNSPEEIVKSENMEQISDTDEIRSIVNKVLDENTTQVETYKSGKTNILGYLMGQVLKMSGGKVNPGVANKILNEEINKR